MINQQDDKKQVGLHLWGSERERGEDMYETPGFNLGVYLSR